MQKHLGSSIPTFDQTLTAVDPLSEIVYEAMEKATVKTRAFFNTEQRPHDPFLAPHLMRFFGKQGLRDAGIHAAEEDGDVSDFEGLPNNGLAFFYKGHHVRILKAATVRGEGWKLPGCGSSEPRTDFYNQQLQIYTDGRGKMHTCSLNVIYVWDFDKLFNLAGVSLGCPKAAAAYAKDVLSHWCEPLRHPALSPGKVSLQHEQSDDGLEALLRIPSETDESVKKA
jgi:hypothetical protein